MATRLTHMLTHLSYDEYRETLQQYRTNNLPRVFDNDNYNHAKILISELAQIAEDNLSYIQIYTTVLCDTIFRDDLVQEAFERAAENGAWLDIIYCGDAAQLGASVGIYRDLFNGRFRIQHGTLKDADGKPLNNFIVINGKAFRYEQEPFDHFDCHLNNRQCMNAVASFNSPENALSLAYYFSEELPFNPGFLERLEFGELEYDRQA